MEISEDYNDDFPAVPRVFLEALEGRFPNKLPDDLRIEDRELWARVGEQRVLQFLREVHNRPPQ